MELEDCFDYVIERAQRTRPRERESLFELAAHLYAAASWLAGEVAGVQYEVSTDPATTSVEALVDQLATWQGMSRGHGGMPPLSGTAIYSLLIEALQLLDAELFIESDRRSQPRAFALGDWPAPGPKPWIVVWNRPKGRQANDLTDSWYRSRVEAIEGARQYKSLPPIPERPDQHLAHHAFARWADSSVAVVPARPSFGEAEIISASGADACGDGFRIALCPIRCESFPFFEVPSPHRHFRVHPPQPMVNPECLQQHLELVIAAAVKRKVHLLVFPELTIDLDTRQWLESRLARLETRWPYGVVAGSFHEIAGDGERGLVNRSRMIYGRHHLMAHDKRGRFFVPRRVIKESPKLFHEGTKLAASLHRLPLEIYEGIDPGARLEVLDTTLGRFVILICKDAICPDRTELLRLVEEIRPDFLLLPSMTPETKRFEALAQRMEHFGVSTFFVNAGRICPKDEILALVQLSHFEPKEGPPTCIAWFRGQQGVRRWDRHGDKRWKHQAALPDGFAWLRGPLGRELGLVVDLGKWVKRRPVS